MGGESQVQSEDGLNSLNKNVSIINEDIKEVDGIRMPTSFLILPQDKPGEMTKITYTKMDFSTQVDPKMFSLQACKNYSFI